jgi:hypothetical protein
MRGFSSFWRRSSVGVSKGVELVRSVAAKPYTPLNLPPKFF